MSLDDRILDDAVALGPDLVRLRRALHAHPEVGLDLPSTQAAVLQVLADLDLEVTEGTALSAVTAVLRGGDSGSAVLLRADMDALPVTEDTGLDFASRIDGAMHACGHDLHTAMLVGAARLLTAHRDQLDGDVVFMFQPGEEGWDGAGLMIGEGVLEASGPRVASAYGIHVLSSRLPRGTFATRPGPLLAASDAMFVTVRGRGGHASAPHHGRDPVVAAAEMVTALQSVVTRRFDVFDPVVLTVGSFHAGSRHNVMPDSAEFAATIRSFSTTARDQMRELAPDVCRQIGAAHGLEVETEYRGEYPPTINHPGETRFVGDVVRDVFGPERFELLANPFTAAEDFSRVLTEVPGCYVFLGALAGTAVEGADNHSPRARFDDSVLADGALLYTQLALRALRRGPRTPPIIPPTG